MSEWNCDSCGVDNQVGENCFVCGCSQPVQAPKIEEKKQPEPQVNLYKPGQEPPPSKNAGAVRQRFDAFGNQYSVGAPGTGLSAHQLSLANQGFNAPGGQFTGGFAPSGGAPSGNNFRQKMSAAPAQVQAAKAQAPQASSSGEWTCPACDFSNDAANTVCELCQAVKGAPVPVQSIPSIVQPMFGQPGQIPNQPSATGLKSEIPLNVIDYTHDIARPAVPMDEKADLNYTECESELVLKDLVLVEHGQVQAERRKKFIQGVGGQGTYCLQSLQQAIIQLYNDVPEYAGQGQTMLGYHMGFVQSLMAAQQQQTNPQFEPFKHIGGEHVQPMVLALNFYTGLMGGDGKPLKKASDKVRLASSNAFTTNAQNARGDLGVYIEEVQWWIQKGLSFIKPVTIPCCRSDNYDQTLIDYFKPGKVFQWMKLSSSNEGVQNVADWQSSTANVIFHIQSQTGRNIQFFSSCGAIENEVLFPPGAEFLVCRIKPDRKGGPIHIYIREIRTGLSKNVICWVDDKLFKATSDPNSQMTPGADLINFIHAHGFQRNITFILKDRTDIAMAYFNSALFKEALTMVETFKLMTNNTRQNEAKGNNEQFIAGPMLIKTLRELMQHSYPGRQQMPELIFCGDGNQTMQNCLQVGLPQQNLPSITVDANVAVKFCLEA